MFQTSLRNKETADQEITKYAVLHDAERKRVVAYKMKGDEDFKLGMSVNFINEAGKKQEAHEQRQKREQARQLAIRQKQQEQLKKQQEQQKIEAYRMSLTAREWVKKENEKNPSQRKFSVNDRRIEGKVLNETIKFKDGEYVKVEHPTKKDKYTLTPKTKDIEKLMGKDERKIIKMSKGKIVRVEGWSPGRDRSR